MTELTRMRLYIDPTWRRGNLRHSPLLYPFWGIAPNERIPLKVLFERHSFDTSVYEITNDISKSDLVFMPYAHNTALQFAPELLIQSYAASRQSGKALLIDGTGEVEYPINFQNTYILRSGGYAFLKKENEIHIPPYVDDLLEATQKGGLSTKPKSFIPIVGFSGVTALAYGQTGRTLLKELPYRAWGVVDTRYRTFKKGAFFQMQALKQLQKSDEVQTNFLTPLTAANNNETSGDINTLQKEFVENILQSDYCLDISGDVNTSAQLYEILSLGRIPVLVDTQRNFPFKEEVDYSSFALSINFKDLHLLAHTIAEFHARVSETQFEEMQKNARRAFTSYFRVDALMSHIIRELKTKGAFT